MIRAEEKARATQAFFTSELELAKQEVARREQEGAAHRVRAQAEASATYQQFAQRAHLLDERQVVESEERAVRLQEIADQRHRALLGQQQKVREGRVERLK